MPPQVEFTPNDQLVHLGGDRWVRDADPIFDDETVELIRTGYMCIDCFQRYEHAFPDNCPFPVCDNKPRTEQSMKFLQRFKGKDETLWQPDGPEEPIGDYMRRTNPERAQRLRERGVWLPTS